MRVNGHHYRTVWLEGDTVRLIDQRRLPFAFEIVSLKTLEETARAIQDMTVRGAGAIGVTAGFALAQAALHAPADTVDDAVERAAARIRTTRPTARNLFYAVDRVLDAVRRAPTAEAKRAQAVAIAQAIADEDAAAGERIGEIGQPLFGPRTTVMTHCNAGWLAFADWGTALAPIYAAARQGKAVHVYVNETRPRAQGAKLTAWELGQEGVPYTLIPDTAAGTAMRQGLIQLILVGADRIAANGDVANKIGTYQLAVLARAHQIPFYVAAPTSTIDLACPTGDDIPIEERAPEEVTDVTGQASDGSVVSVRTAAQGARAKNWAFDVTPASYLSGILTERGVIPATPAAIEHLLHEVPGTFPAKVPGTSLT